MVDATVDVRFSNHLLSSGVPPGHCLMTAVCFIEIVSGYAAAGVRRRLLLLIAIEEHGFEPRTGFEPVHEDAMSRRILPLPRRLMDRSEL